ncbi:hypothetical protein H112_06503 [Trichophyton rubrum D6]|uniref:Probable lysosomal cobalamin transporter n=3 Tax=Trichophyton rubrum TaxID=5551 RepID=A0A178F0T7_TRIRU|nr:uncharacterized protein TERG_01864 [Trichophyton rubrum CBS 118892]EZF12962.1 hypothetical protein H100_06519 [Trichophyton rubrum MR850]EZF39394.1 hypothetical protein H102_06486 [Trichophyton rubrum CBS 100081]EZF49978.1 hypothetical protein H103_06512 [Trichophyton rubrum CBS 288.86]EZF60628.1 hypothetical protein H104_06494 [Trichophyton rubrum CBS 289.86]EZF81950.1 hypothetical protein H110_06506 [Trichophyton rubrum MR1448]EZF92610.1 hypothetical protein H113_06556 [Trichophyton rubr
MTLLQSSLIWIVYAVVVAILIAIASVFVYVYQAPRERSGLVSAVCILTVSALLATVLLLPVDIALISSTNSRRLGQRKDWATPDAVASIVQSLTIVYYSLYSLDTILCLLVIPFTYFWYEEYDELAEQQDWNAFGKRFWGAFRYTIAFLVVTVILFLVGFFVPVARNRAGAGLDLDYFKHLLTENNGERALTFALGLLTMIGIIVYVLYTSAGLALFPVSFIKTAPSVSSPSLYATTASRLEENVERQRQLEGRCGGNLDHLSSKERRELDSLVREERTLRRRQRLAESNAGDGRSFLVKAWHKIEAVFRPIKLLGGLLLLLLSIVIWVSMLLTGIDKATNSICKHNCGYILAKVNVFNPINWALLQSAKVFPIDYVLFIVLVLHFFSSSVVGVATVGIRFLWVRIFGIRKGHTTPQALLLATVMLALIILALNFSISMMVAPQYATYGPQTFCDTPSDHGEHSLSCEHRPQDVKPCSELTENHSAKDVCTPSVVSVFLNRITLNYPFFGMVNFWAQFAFLGMSLIVFVTMLFRTPRLDEQQLDEDAEEAEEEGLLASTGRRFGATWEDIMGRAPERHPAAAGRGSRDNGYHDGH